MLYDAIRYSPNDEGGVINYDSKEPEIAFNTDIDEVKRRLEESSKTIDARVKAIEDAKYISQEMLRLEIKI